MHTFNGKFTFQHVFGVREESHAGKEGKCKNSNQRYQCCEAKVLTTNLLLFHMKLK